MSLPVHVMSLPLPFISTVTVNKHTEKDDETTEETDV